MFQEIIKRMSPYLRKEPTEENVLTLDSYPSHSGGSTVSVLGLPKQHQRQPVRNLTSEQIEKTIDISLNSNSYVEHARNDFIYGLSGHLFHNGIMEALTAVFLISSTSSNNSRICLSVWNRLYL